MNEKHEIQQELFDDFAGQSKLKRRALQPNSGKRIHTFILSNEQLSFILIGFIILLVICFSLGVEKGKHIAVSRPVQAKTQQPAASKAQLKPNPQPAIVYVVQVGSYSSNKEAENEKTFLTNKGYRATVVKSNDHYWIYVGGYSTQQDADAAVNKLKNKYKDCFSKRWR